MRMTSFMAIPSLLHVCSHEPSWRKLLEFQRIIEKRTDDQEQKHFCRST